ncbi:MAG: 7TM diverse intracellular signaling domain-containing protein [Bacteroidota bacterium]
MRLFSIIIFSLFFFPASGGNVHVLESNRGLLNLGGKAEIYEDKSAQLELNDILKSEIQNQFSQSETEVPLFNVTSSTIWMKMTFTTRESQRWYLLWGLPSVQQATLYRVKQNHTDSLISGILIDAEKRSLIGHNVLFHLGLSPGDTATFYLRINDIAPLRVIMKAGSIEDIFAFDFVVNFWHGAFYGITMLMILYNLFLFFTSRKRVYLYYVMFVFSATMFTAFFTGYVLSLPGKLLWIYIHIPVVFPLSMGIFGLLFTFDFLNTKKYTPLLHKIAVIFCFTIIVPFVVSASGDQRNGILITQILGLILGVLSILMGVKALIKGNRAARFYVLGFGTYMLTLIILIANDFIGSTTEFISMYLLIIGSAVEAIMLSFAIGDKLNNANREKHLAQKEALESSRENEKLVREQNVVLEKKVTERTAEISRQKDIIEEKQKEIVDSINYAKRLQQAILVRPEEIERHFKESFLHFRPKDIVAGDFYFFEKTSTHLFLAAADCTGHGVPGAMMSIVCSNALSRCVKEFNLSDPGKILDKTSELVIETFVKSGEDVKDGMDISFLSIEISTRKIKWSGANNPLWVIEKGQATRDKGQVEIKENKPDKQPIGKSAKVVPFTTHEIEASEGDILILFTDGFADQFGGEKGKKFKYKNLQKLIIENLHLPLSELNHQLSVSFENWKGDLEQVDDVCVIGIRILNKI